MSFDPALAGVQQSSYELQGGDVSRKTKVLFRAHLYSVEKQHL